MHVKILIADEQRLFTESLAELVHRTSGMEVAGTACSSREVLEKINFTGCDVLLAGGRLAGSDGLPIAQWVKRRFPHVKVVLLVDREPALARQLSKMEAVGYVLKTDSREELFAAIRSVAAGITYFSPSIKGRNPPPGRKRTQDREPEELAGKMELTHREKEIVRLVAQAYSSNAIAEKLFISPKTVNTHRRNLMKKLQVSNSFGVINYAMQQGFI